MDCSLPGSSVHGIFQVRILERVAISSSRGSSQFRDQTCISSIAGGFFTTEPSGTLPRWYSGKKYTCQRRRHKRHGFHHWIGKVLQEEEMATHLSILAWEIREVEDPGGLQSMELQRVRHNWVCTHKLFPIFINQDKNRTNMQSFLKIVIISCNGRPFCYKRELIIGTCKNMDESQNNHAEWKKPEQRKRVHRVWFHLYKILENASYIDWEQLRGCLGWGRTWRSRGKEFRRVGGHCGGWGYIHYLGSYDSFLRIYGHQMIPNQTL